MLTTAVVVSAVGAVPAGPVYDSEGNLQTDFFDARVTPTTRGDAAHLKVRGTSFGIPPLPPVPTPCMLTCRPAGMPAPSACLHLSLSLSLPVCMWGSVCACVHVI